MKNPISAIADLLFKLNKVNWFIVHDLSKAGLVENEIQFTFVDGKERFDEPFGTNLGYISINEPKSYNEFCEEILNLADVLKDNPVALANIFIILLRLSTNSTGNDILERFKSQIDATTCVKVYDLLVDSLNLSYFSHRNLKQYKYDTLRDWLEVLNGAQYHHGFSDPVTSILILVKDGNGTSLDFAIIRKMAPLLRAHLIGFFGYNIAINNKDLFDIILTDEKEAAFFAGYIIEEKGSNRSAVEWLSENIVRVFIEMYWNNIGKDFFFHVFGLSFRNKGKNQLYKDLESDIHQILLEKFQSADLGKYQNINTFKYPHDFIALYNWFSVMKIKPSSISEINTSTIVEQFLNQLESIVENVPEYLAKEKYSDPFESYSLSEGKFLTALAFQLLFLLCNREEDIKRLKDICFKFKPLFYGGFQSTSIASHFAETILIMLLSTHLIHDLNEGHFNKLKKLLSVAEETILIPYIHLAERDEEIWNPETEKQVFSFNAGKYLVNDYLKKILNSELKEHYASLFSLFDDVKIAKWPYERS